MKPRYYHHILKIHTIFKKLSTLKSTVWFVNLPSTSRIIDKRKFSLSFGKLGTLLGVEFVYRRISALLLVSIPRPREITNINAEL